MAPRKPRKSAAAVPEPPEPAAADVIEHVTRPEPLQPEPYAYPDPDAQVIGQGATGDMGEYPECPVCLAHGGGGHGSNCPNAGKDPADWVTEPPDGWTAPGRSAA